jgi:hypothetical protein
VTYTTEFDRITLGDADSGIVVMCCRRCGSLTAPTTWSRHAAWHAAQESGAADASSMAVAVWEE